MSIRVASIEVEGIAAAYDPVEVLVDGPRVFLQVDAEHSSYELTASKALELSHALQRAAFLACPLDDSEAVPIVRELVVDLESMHENFDTDTQLERSRKNLEPARAWLARHWETGK